mgnify:FL=1
MYLFLVAFFVIHLILQIGFLLFSFGTGMAEFDNPNDSSLRIKGSIYDGVYSVLTFPVVFMFYNLVFDSFFENYPFAGWIWFLFPYILNSALWTLILYFILKKIYKFQDK